MRLDVITRRLPAPTAIRAHARRSARATFRRFDHALAGVRVFLEDENGPRGGRALRCRVVALPAGRAAPIVVEAVETTANGALSRALDGARRALRRRLDRNLRRRARRGKVAR